VNLNLVEELESRRGGIKVAELANILGVDDKHIYRMAARGQLPSFRVGGAVRFDPQEVAKWLREKYHKALLPPKKEVRRSTRQAADTSAAA
jgi:excisionase family DNA binding protein